jgi:hypothetical protein
MALQHQDPAQTTNLTASEAEPAQTRRRNSNLFNLGVFDDDTCLLQDEFRSFLEKSGFVEEVIDFYIDKDRRLLTENPSGTDSSHHSEPLNTAEWEHLVRTRLPGWLFWLTYILTAQARLAEEKRKCRERNLRRSSTTDCFARPKMTCCSERIGRNFGHQPCLEILFMKLSKTSAYLGRVTLENVAMSINFRSTKASSPIKLLTPLSGKHLQKLLRQNDIKWIEIKRRYVTRLLRLRRASW